MKKIIALCMLLVFSVIFLVGCSSGSEDQASSDDPLVVWTMGSEGEFLAQMADGFTEETGIPVEIVPIPWDQAHDKLLTAVASHEGPDVLQLGTTWIAEFAEAGALADMSEYTSVYPETFNPDSYFASSSDYMYYEEQMIAVPWMADTRILYYRTDQLAEVGYTEAPATWDELYDCATKLVENGSDYGLWVDSYDIAPYLIYPWSYGWTYFDENGEPNFDDPMFQETLEYWNQYYVDGLASLDKNFDIATSFFSGECPMFIGGPWFIQQFHTDYPEMEENWNVAVMPAGDIQTSFLGGSTLSIFEWSDQKDEAAQFIDWVNQPAQQVQFYQLSGAFPTRIATYEDPALADDEDLAVVKAQFETATAHPVFPQMETIGLAVSDEAHKFYYGEQDIETTITGIMESANKALEE